MKGDRFGRMLPHAKIFLPLQWVMVVFANVFALKYHDLAKASYRLSKYF